MKKTACIAVISLFWLVQLTGCGSSASSAPQQQKSASIKFSIFSNLTTHIGGVEIAARLPEGVQVALDQNTHELSQPNLRSAKGIVLGTYSASTRTAHLVVADGSFNIGSGEFATLDCTVLPGFTLTQESFTALNAPFPLFKATGIDLVNNSSISTDNVLKGKITPAIAVSFGF
jgi:hypothetical protein